MERKVITFCGHKDVYDSEKVYLSLKSILTEIFSNAHSAGQSLTFLCGHYGAFDALSSKAIDEIRRLFPMVKNGKIVYNPLHHSVP